MENDHEKNAVYDEKGSGEVSPPLYHTKSNAATSSSPAPLGFWTKVGVTPESFTRQDAGRSNLNETLKPRHL